jgi:hypothetical protein
MVVIFSRPTIVIDGRGMSDKARPDFVAPPIYKTFDEIGAQLEKIQAQEAENFGVDATRREQEAADSKRSVRTPATGSSAIAGLSGEHPNTVKDAWTSTQGNGTGPVRLPEQAGPSGTASPGSDQQNPGGRTGATDNGREPGTDGLPETGARGKDRRGTGSEGDPGENNTDGLAERAGKGSRRPVASDGQTDYNAKSKAKPIGTLTPTNMARSIQTALDKVAEIHGSVDEYVKQQLQFHSDAELYKAQEAERLERVKA